MNQEALCDAYKFETVNPSDIVSVDQPSFLDEEDTDFSEKER